MKSRPESAHPPPSQPPVVSPGGNPVYPSQRLFQGGNTVWIDHDGEIYTLRRTRQGKLILTK